MHRTRFFIESSFPRLPERLNDPIIADMLPSQFKTQYFQWLFENETNYGMISCPSGKISESKGRIGSKILLGYEKEVLYMLI